MKTFQQFNEETPKEFESLKKTGEKFKKFGKEFVDSGQADDLKNAAMNFLFKKIDKAVEGGNKKYNEIKSNAKK